MHPVRLAGRPKREKRLRFARPGCRIMGRRRRNEEGGMPPANDWNDKIIAEFRANQGRVGGHFEGAPIVLVHHRGRKSGREYINPMMYLPHDIDDDIIYVFASKAGAPSNPDWYHNLIAAGEATIERGTETY